MITVGAAWVHEGGTTHMPDVSSCPCHEGCVRPVPNAAVAPALRGRPVVHECEVGLVKPLSELTLLERRMLIEIVHPSGVTSPGTVHV